MSTPTTMRLTSDVDLAFAGKDKRPTFRIDGYNGGPVKVSGWSALLVTDLKGMQPENQVIPVLKDHNPEAVVGQGKVDIGKSSVTVNGNVTGTTGAAAEVLEHAKNGFQWRASIGLSVDESEFLNEGATAVVNGKRITGPMWVIRKSTLAEVSFVSLAADSTTSASIAARKAGEASMPEPTKTPEPSLRVQLARLTSTYIEKAPGEREEFERLETHALENNLAPDEHELALLRASRPRTGGITGHRPNGVGLSRELIQCGLMLRGGHEKLAVKLYGEKVAEQSHHLRLNTWASIGEAALKLSGRFEHFDNHSEMIRQAFSTTSLPGILANVLGKTLVAAYEEAASDVRLIATVKNAANFHPQAAIRPSAIESLEEVGATGDIKHTVLKEEDQYAWRVGTFARMVGVDRKHIVNDDLSFFGDLPGMLATAAVRSLYDLVWSTILAGQAGGFFSVANGNLLEAASALSIETLGDAVAMMKSQRDSQFNDLNIVPKVLAVPTGLETVARPLLNSSEIVTGENETKPSGNPVSGIVPSLVVESRISNVDKFGAAANESQWFLFGGPSSNAVIVGFLNGQSTPIVEVEPAPFHTLGMQMRAYHDFGAALGDHRGALKATGAAAAAVAATTKK